MSFSKKNFELDDFGLASKLMQGSAALLPTDTLAALAARPDYADQLWHMKRRPLEKPLILMAASVNELLACALPIAFKDAALMANRYWPGALTMILPASGPMVEALNPGKSNLGMRVPDCDMTLKLLKRSGPLATTSANYAGDSPSLSAECAAKYFPQVPLLSPLPWPKGSGLASTVISWRDCGRWQVLRKGAVILEDV